MRFAVDIREWEPGRQTGIGRFLEEFVRTAVAAKPQDHFLLVGDTRSEARVQAGNATVIHIPVHRTLWWDQVTLRQVLTRHAVDVFYSPYVKVPLLAPMPVVSTIHDLIPIHFPAYREGSGWLYATAFRIWAGLLARRAAAVVTDSLHSRQDIAETLGVDAGRVHAIPIGVGAEFRPSLGRERIREVAASYGIAGAYLLTVTNFLPHKNLLRLVQAYASLAGTLRQRCQLVLAGTPGGHAFARPVERAQLEAPGVVFPGFIAPEDLPYLYAGATALVFSSLTEGFGLPVLEAMACGTPVVCARAGALPEVVGDAALYVDPTDVRSITEGLQRILVDAGLRQDLSARGLARARLFDARKTTARLVDLLESIAAGREPRPCQRP